MSDLRANLEPKLRRFASTSDRGQAERPTHQAGCSACLHPHVHCWQMRQSDHAFLTSPKARELLDREAITVIDYRPLQRAWNA
jgi:hypothetical protein